MEFFERNKQGATMWKLNEDKNKQEKPEKLSRKFEYVLVPKKKETADAF